MSGGIPVFVKGKIKIREAKNKFPSVLTRKLMTFLSKNVILDFDIFLHTDTVLLFSSATLMLKSWK